MLRVPEAIKRHPGATAAVVAGGAFLFLRLRRKPAPGAFAFPAGAAGQGGQQDLASVGSDAVGIPGGGGQDPAASVLASLQQQLQSLLGGGANVTGAAPGTVAAGYAPAPAYVPNPYQQYGYQPSTAQYTPGYSPGAESATGSLLGSSLSALGPGCTPNLHNKCNIGSCKGFFGCLKHIVSTPFECTAQVVSNVATCGARIGTTGIAALGAAGPSAGALLGPLGPIASGIGTAIGTIGQHLDRPGQQQYSGYQPYQQYTPPYTPPIAPYPGGGGYYNPALPYAPGSPYQPIPQYAPQYAYPQPQQPLRYPVADRQPQIKVTYV